MQKKKIKKNKRKTEKQVQKKKKAVFVWHFCASFDLIEVPLI